MLKFDKRILIVDDMRTMRAIMRRHFFKLGFTDIIEGVDGRDAMGQLEVSAPPVALIISDWNMPELNGQEFLEEVRANDKFKEIPFIMVTAESDENIEKEAREAGVTDFMLKPLARDIIEELLLKLPSLNM